MTTNSATPQGSGRHTGADGAPSTGGVAVFGEALVDVLPTSPTTWKARPGGSPANIAVATARLGVPTWFLGGLSRDRWGTMLADHLSSSGVDVHAAPRSDLPTAMALVTLADDGTADYRFLWDGTADRAVTIGDLPADPGPATWLQVGSVAAALADSGATAVELASRERGRRLVSCDPNVRTVVHGDDPEVAARIRRIMATADLVKASDEDLEFLVDGDVTTAADQLLDAAGLVAITRGSRGAMLVGRAGRVEIPPVSVTVADTVGAGDTFMAGLLAALSEIGIVSRDGLAGLDRDTLSAVGCFASAAAAATVSRVGADPPHRDDLPPEVAVG